MLLQQPYPVLYFVCGWGSEQIDQVVFKASSVQAASRIETTYDWLLSIVVTFATSSEASRQGHFRQGRSHFARSALTHLLAHSLHSPWIGCRHQWGLLFSNDAKLSDLIAQVLVILTGYVIFDGVSAVLGGVVKGVGKQLLATPIVLFSYYVVGLPLAALFGFKLKWGVRGLCFGMLLGTAVHAVCFFILVWRMDWNLEAHKAAARVGVTKRVGETLQGLIVDQQGKDENEVEEEEQEVENTGQLALEHVIDPYESQNQKSLHIASGSQQAKQFATSLVMDAQPQAVPEKR